MMKHQHQNGYNNGHHSGGGNSTSSNGSFDAINKKSTPMVEEFDFEKNLALFDKNAFYEEMMNESGVPGPQQQQNHHQQQHQQQPPPRPASSSYLSILSNHTSSSHNLSSRSGGLGDNNNNNGSSSGRNYRYDEMILDTGDPINFQQIQVSFTNS